MFAKWLHALLVGVAGAALTALAQVFATTDPATFTSSPVLLGVVGAVLAAASRFIGSLVSKLGAPPAQ